jgi:hypothetical protein
MEKEIRYSVRIENGRARLYRNGTLATTLCTDAVTANIVGDEVQVVTDRNRTVIYKCSNGCKVTSF